MMPQSVVDDDDEAELLRRCPTARVERIDNAGHSVQGDTPPSSSPGSSPSSFPRLMI